MKLIEDINKTILILHEAFNSILTIIMIMIENESIICAESESSFYKKEPGFPISLNTTKHGDFGISYRGILL